MKCSMFSLVEAMDTETFFVLEARPGSDQTVWLYALAPIE
jgi:hypothetical protein